MSRHHKWLGIVVLFLVCSAQADDFDDFTNNLFTDLAPIIALFGERVTTQFLSQALGWADCIALAMAPLGIITIIVSAIRVGGPMSLKAVVGRAKENISDVEMELMSSTSREVCDLYNGTSIVRSSGTAPVWEYICLFPKCSSDSSAKNLQVRFMTLEQAVEDGLLEDLAAPPKNSEKVTPKSQGIDGDPQATTTSISTKRALRNRLLSLRHVGFAEGSRVPENSDTEQGTSHRPPDRFQAQSDTGVLENSTTTDEAPILTVVHDTGLDAPNISLNLQNTHKRFWIRLVATIGVILQSGVMIFFGLMTHPKFQSRFQRDDKPVATHAAPMAVTGTGLLVLGMIICGHVIEDSTEEKRYRATGNHEIGVYWVQQEQTVADRVFESFATNPSTPRSVITTSQKKADHPEVLHFEILKVKTTVGVLIGLVGFVVQFIGLRAMNSWATLAQLVAIGLMTLLRAIVRPAFTKSFEKAKLFPGFELDWLAWKLVDKAHGGETSSDSPSTGSMAGSTSVPSIKNKDAEKQHIPLGSWAVNTGGSVEYHPFKEPTTAGDDPTPHPSSEAHNVMTTRRELCKLAGFHGKTAPIAVNLALAIEKAMNVLFPCETEAKTFRWYIDVGYSRTDPKVGSMQQVWFDISHNGASWQVLADNFDACLSLWSYTIQSQEQQSGERDRSRDPVGMEDDSWLRKRRPGMCFRLLGPKSEQLIQDLKWWVPQGTETVIEVHGIAEREPRTNKYISEKHESRTVDYSRIVGYSPYFQPPRSEVSGLQTLDIVTSLSEKSGKGVSLAIETRDSLIDLYAKDLLFSFMCSAANTLKEPIPSKTELRPAGVQFSPYSSCSLWNQDLSELAEALCELGFGLAQEAYISIVSALSLAQKLPFPQALFDSAYSEMIKTFNSTTHHFVSHLISQLWGVASSYLDGDTGIWERFLVLQLEVAKEASTTIDSMRIEGSVPIPWGLDVCLFSVDEGFQQRPEDDLINCLAYLYKKQCRQMWTGITRPKALTSEEPPQFPDYFNLTELHHAAMSTSETKIGDILESGKWSSGYVNRQDICHWTALHYAAVRGNMPFIKAFVFPSASDIVELVDINLRDFRGYTALHYACEHGHSGIIKLLLRLRASLEAHGLNGVTPMHLAAGNKSPEVMELITEGTIFYKRIELRMSLTDCNGRLPIHWAVMGGQVMNLPIFEYQLNEPDKFGWTPLHLAVVYNQLEVVDKLLELLADKDKKDKSGRTALYLACERGNLDALKRLNEAGADCNSAANNGKTPLHEAAALQPEEVTLARKEERTEFPVEKDYGTGIELVKFLVSCQANPYCKDNRGKTPIDIAEEEGHTEVLNYLRPPAKRDSQTKLSQYWGKV